MRVAFVVQRYGRRVNGGAEQHCRMLAERLTANPDVDDVSVYTTCAKDYRRWTNHYPAGVERIDGVRVERFPTRLERLPFVTDALTPLLRRRSVPALDRLWLMAQGPYAPELIERLAQASDEHDAFVFFTYLYHPTVLGLPLVRHKAVLIPTAHDEPAIRLRMFRSLFQAPRALAFNTVEERDLVHQLFDNADLPYAIVGSGVRLAGADTPGPSDRLLPSELHAPFVLFVGRLGAGKGIRPMLAAFRSFRAACGARTFPARRGGRFRGGDLRLAIAGAPAGLDLAAEPGVVTVGFVDEETKAALLRNAEVLLQPSPHESLSLVALEAWSAGTPTLANADCAVTAGLTEASGGGLTFRFPRFGNELAALLDDLERRRAMGQAGAAFVRRRYGWPQVERRLLELLRAIADEARAPRGDRSVVARTER